jgi:BirA family transcriptional regulator, biotin operon repressor / biotin---[acetyl-CoA-carboxylase] ligase
MSGPHAFHAPFALAASDYAAAPSISLTVVRETGSTNSDLMARARAGQLSTVDSGRTLALIAHAQNAGRGRMGRSWQAQAGASLLMSVAVLRSEPAGAFAALTLALGIAAAQALRSLQVPVQLKWPNDLLLGNAKLSGVLVESASTREGTVLVAGIGVNGVLSAAQRAALQRPVAALEDVLPLTPALAARVGHALLHAFADTLRAPPPDAPRVTALFNALHAHHDREVVLLRDDQPAVRGRVQGIDAQGRLLLHDGQTVRTFSSGEVSLQP